MIKRLFIVALGLFLLSTSGSKAYNDTSIYEDSSYNFFDILSSGDVTTYQQIFDAQENGNWQKADQLISNLNNDILMGYVLYQRYMHKDYRSKYSELKNWLDKYYGLPEAEKIYITATRKSPTQDSNLKPPQKHRRIVSGSSFHYKGWLIGSSYKHLSEDDQKEALSIMKTFRWHIKKGRTKSAKYLLDNPDTTKLLTHKDFDMLRGGLAFQYFIDCHDEYALEWAEPAVARSGDSLALWTAGLASWRTENYKKAEKYFSLLANTSAESPWLKASGAYWAGRAALRNNHPDNAIKMLSKASQNRYTFYGILARHTLGLNLDYKWNYDNKISPSSESETLFSNHKARRAGALLQIGMEDMAEKEFYNSYYELNQAQKNELIKITEEYNMPALSFAIAPVLTNKDEGIFYNSGRYPTPDWEPEGGWEIDKALIYAFIRQESNFNPRAVSPSGAVGLMQLMPGTASIIGGSRKYASTHELSVPETNIRLGQKYISRLMNIPQIGDNLFFIASSYNGGPGNFIKWQKRMKYNNDPLLFIESLPSKETRLFIERILANLWIYRSKFEQESPSLDALASGNWPRYIEQDSSSFAALR